MKRKLSFVLSNNGSDLNSLVNIMGSYEDIEANFGIEFAAGIENVNGDTKIIFASDYLFTDKEDEFLNKYDGMVVSEYFRDKNTKQIYDLNESGCRLDIMYDDEYHYTGSEKFSNPKIITKGYSYGYTTSRKRKM